jgi:hypothetical protein
MPSSDRASDILYYFGYFQTFGDENGEIEDHSRILAHWTERDGSVHTMNLLDDKKRD